MVLIKAFYAYNSLRNFSYVISDVSTGNTWIVDPYESSVLVDYIKKNGFVLKGILNTHQHDDHIRGNDGLIDLFNAPVKAFSNYQSIDLGHQSFLEILDTPGHTLDHQVFVWKKDGLSHSLFSGDSLFNAGVGNCHGGGDVLKLYESTCLLNKLADYTLLHPGHDYRKRNLEFAQSVEPENRWIIEKLKELKDFNSELLPPVTLGEEKLVNPFLRLGSQEIRQNVLVKKMGLSEQEVSDRELFIHLRKLRDQW